MGFLVPLKTYFHKYIPQRNIPKLVFPSIR